MVDWCYGSQGAKQMEKDSVYVGSRTKLVHEKFEFKSSTLKLSSSA